MHWGPTIKWTRGLTWATFAWQHQITRNRFHLCSCALYCVFNVMVESFANLFGGNGGSWSHQSRFELGVCCCCCLGEAVGIWQCVPIVWLHCEWVCGNGKGDKFIFCWLLDAKWDKKSVVMKMVCVSGSFWISFQYVMSLGQIVRFFCLVLSVWNYIHKNRWKRRW